MLVPLPKAAGYLRWWCGMTLAFLKSILALVGTAVLLLQMGISSPVARVRGSLWLLSDD